MDLVYMWCIIGIIFIIIEFFTVTTYGLGLAIASFIVAIYVSLSGIASFEITQFIVMLVVTVPLVLTFPKLLSGKIVDTAVGPDVYIGQNVEIFKNGNIWKVKLDGVEYPATATDKRWFRNNKEVTIVGHNGGIFTVEKI